MNVSIGYCEDVLKTLPVGYYLGHRVSAKLDPTGDDTYINMDTESITISYNNIVTMLKNAPDDIDRESVIRGLFYHEISHALLTYRTDVFKEVMRIFDKGFLRGVKSQLSSKPEIKAQQIKYLEENFHDIMNIFEDERIETMCKNYYMNVDFKRNLFLINGIDPMELVNNEDPIKRFYAVVRYRVGKPEFIEIRDALIARFTPYTFAKLKYLDDKSRDYFQSVLQFFVKIMKDKPKKSSMQSARSKQPGQDSNKTPSENMAGNTAQKALSDSQINQILDNFNMQNTDRGVDCGALKTIAQKLSTNIYAAQVKAQLEKILTEALNKNKNRASSSLAYAGRIDPRSTVSKDYRWFAKKTAHGAAKHFDKVHFNLFCDNSGSFTNSKAKMNSLICALKNIESNNPDFSVTVLHCANGITIPDQDNPYLDCNGGSHLPETANEIYKSVQKPNATNINLVVFDGRMHLPYDEAGKANFAAFNHPNCIVISDTDNEDAFKTYAPQARSTFITDKYADVFINEALTLVGKLIA